MTTLTLQNTAQKQALVYAIDCHHERVLEDIASEVDELTEASDENFDSALSAINASRKTIAFLEAFQKGLSDVPVGISVYLESFETDVVREALESVADIEDGDERSVEDVFSVNNIKQAVLASQTAWGSLDVEALSRTLSEQAGESVDGNSATQDLLDALN